jgi:hypothetical protein
MGILEAYLLLVWAIDVHPDDVFRVLYGDIPEGIHIILRNSTEVIIIK